MRKRWQEWVIVLGVLSLFVTGVLALWGEDLDKVFRGEKKRANPSDVKLPAPGPAAGPF